MEKRPTFEDFAVVYLTHPVQAPGGVIVPGGAKGVVMATYADGLAYEVEFESPARLVLTLEERDIRPAKESTRDVPARGKPSRH